MHYIDHVVLRLPMALIQITRDIYYIKGKLRFMMNLSFPNDRYFNISVIQIDQSERAKSEWGHRGLGTQAKWYAGGRPVTMLVAGLWLMLRNGTAEPV